MDSDEYEASMSYQRCWCLSCESFDCFHANSAGNGDGIGSGVTDVGYELVWAAGEGNLDAVKLWLSRKAYINDYGGHMGTDRALPAASRNGHLHVVKYLLQRGASIDLKGQSYPPIYWAAQEGKDEILVHLLKYGGDVNWLDNCDETALIAAVRRCSYDSVKSLLEAGADPTVGATPLVAACRWSENNVVNILLAYGADVNKTYYEVSPLKVAFDIQDAEVFDALLLYGVSKAEYSQRLQQTTKGEEEEGYVALTKFLIKTKVAGLLCDFDPPTLEKFTDTEFFSPQEYESDCLQEMNRLKVDMLTDDVPYYAFIESNITEMLPPRIIALFNHSQCKSEYPIYYNMLSRNHAKASINVAKREKLQTKAVLANYATRTWTEKLC